MTRLSLLLVTLALTLVAETTRAQELNVAEEAAIREAVDRVAPSVLQIETVGGLVQGGEPLEGASRTTGTPLETYEPV